MKDLNPKQVDDIAGGVEPQQFESQLAPDVTADANGPIDYNPDRTPK